MKAILAFAFLVIAAQATTPAYILGFTEQIGLNSEQMKHGEVCFESLKTIMMDVHHLIQSKNIGLSEVLRSAITLIEDLDKKLTIDCSVYLNDVVSTLLRNSSHGNLEEVARKNWNTYPLEIIQQYTLFRDAVIVRNDYVAGKTEAYIYQILLGVEKPKVLPLPELNSSRYVEVNFTKYINDFTKSYYNTLGIYDSKGIRDNIECAHAQLDLNNAMISLERHMRYTLNTTEKMRALESLINGVLKFGDSCYDAYAFQFQHILFPIMGAFKVSPAHATLAMVHNLGLHLPEMKQNFFKMVVDLHEGRYSEAGKTNAELLITLVSNIYAKQIYY